MKGTIVKCLEEAIKTKYGDDRWKDILVASGMPATTFFVTTSVVPDEDVFRLLQSTAKVLCVTTDEAMDVFGDFWSTSYAPSIYGVYYKKAKSAREFLLNLDHVHVAMTKSAGASPPRFRYEWRKENHLVMQYDSPRGMVALMPGLIRGVGRYFREALTVSVSGNEVHIFFPAAAATR